MSATTFQCICMTVGMHLVKGVKEGYVQAFYIVAILHMTQNLEGENVG